MNSEEKKYIKMLFSRLESTIMLTTFVILCSIEAWNFSVNPRAPTAFVSGVLFLAVILFAIFYLTESSKAHKLEKLLEVDTDD